MTFFIPRSIFDGHGRSEFYSGIINSYTQNDRDAGFGQWDLIFYNKHMDIQYWCIDGKYTIDVARLRNGERTSFSEFLIIKER
jgi:hypothetical protein